jgi:uracil-DNA glycosylase
MDQSKMAGVGNYILAEGLYRAGIDPFCCLSELTEDQQRYLFAELQSVALDSYRAQGMTRADGGQYRTMDGSRGSYAFELQCYGRTDTDSGERVIKLVNGPHKRTIWYTDGQLFMPRHEREAAGDRIEGNTKEQSEKKEEDSTYLEANSRVVQKLTNHLMNSSWTKALSSTLESDTFAKLAQFVEYEWQTQEIYPPLHQVFAALNLCPLDQVKVVIVGQDPYHGLGQGHGLAFSVQQGTRPPPSLVNIFREAQADVGIPPPPHGNLDHWAQQGVLLLNTVLTVRRGQANSHARHGWEPFTDEIIKQLNARPQGLVFLLWGSPAQKKAAAIDESRHTVIRTSHPSPLGATKTKAPFLGSKCFSRANQALEELGHTAIDWSVV